MLKSDGIIVAPGAYDALSAKIIEKCNFSALYLTGFGMSGSLLGKPDIGLLTLNDVTTHVKNIDNVVFLPIIADAEAGFGNALNVMRTVKEYEKAGAVAIHLEDRVLPKNYGQTESLDLVSTQEHTDKIRAAIEARKDNNFLIIARTEAAEKYGINEAISRMNIYLEAGADISFVHGIQTSSEHRLVCQEIRAPNVINYGTLIQSPNGFIPSLSETKSMGFKIAIFPITPLLSAMRAMKTTLKTLAREGTIRNLLPKLMDVETFKLIVDAHCYDKWEQKYLRQKVDKL